MVLEIRGRLQSQVMVAEPRSRRKGIAAEALLLIMAYAFCTLASAAFYCAHEFASPSFHFTTRDAVKVDETVCNETEALKFLPCLPSKSS